MKMRKIMALPVLVAGMLAAGCAQPPPPPPHSLAEYEQMRVSNPRGYPQKTIVMNNLQRVLNPDMATADRVESLRLVLHLGAEDEQVRDSLSAILTEPNSPYELHRTVLTFLLAKDHPGLAAYVVPALSRADRDPALRDAILEWLTRHPNPAVLGEIVKLWASEPSATGPNEHQFRLIVESIAGRPWDRALLDGINSSSPFARGRALEILAKRIVHDSLKKRILSLPPQTSSMASLQSFIETFDYLPETRAEFAATTTIFKTRMEMIGDAAVVDAQWRRRYGYQFNIRDFHLLSRIARDPLRTMLRRTQLILELGRSLARRRHVRYSARTNDRASVQTDRFGLQVERLTISDLWNMYLFNEMFSRPRMQLALRIIAGRNRSDPDGARSGLIFYQHGQAEAMLYPPAEGGDQSAPGGSASARMVREGRDALARFYTHFEKVYNSSRVGPSDEEMRAARQGNYYGVILTSINEYSFCAHYYTPTGLVVSLGRFPFRK